MTESPFDGLPEPLVIVGPLPPPISGRASVMDLIVLRLKRLGTKFEVLDISPTQRPTRKAFRALRRRRLLLAPVLVMVKSRRARSALVMTEGSPANILLAATVLILRLRKVEIVIHHHSWKICSSYSATYDLLRRTAGQGALHWFLCNQMRQVHEDTYGRVETAIVSNREWLPSVARSPETDRSHAVGYLGRIREDKGVHDLATIAESGIAVRLAGPIDRSQLALTRSNSLTYLGEISCDRKRREFFDSIDLYVLASTHPNEAEPMAVIEALSTHTPVLATRIGCLPDMLPSFATYASSEELIAFVQDVVGLSDERWADWLQHYFVALEEKTNLK